MNKAILVIDMPSCCYECFAFNDSGDYPECLITKDYRGYKFRPREQKMYNCPLKPAPEEVEVMWGSDSQEYQQGYNACIENILDA